MIKHERKTRKYITTLEKINITNVKKITDFMKKEKIKSVDNLEVFIKKLSELINIVMCEYTKLQISMMCNVKNQDAVKCYNSYNQTIITPFYQEVSKLKRKIFSSKYFKELNNETYEKYRKIVEVELNSFNKENLDLENQISVINQQYNKLIASFKISINDKDYTYYEAQKLYKDSDSNKREQVWKKSMKWAHNNAEKLDGIFDVSLKIRTQIAKNAGFDNFRDYMHYQSYRFDYTPEKLYEFHDSVEKVVIPVLKRIYKKISHKLGISDLKPWDLNLNVIDRVLKPFDNIDEFVDKSINTLSKIDPIFGNVLNNMRDAGYLDLEDRDGKGPARGFSAPIEEFSSSFIFMKATGNESDVQAILHESGHSIHSYFRKDIDIIEYQYATAETAKVASMTMELFGMENIDQFFESVDEQKSYKFNQFLGIIKQLPRFMIIDAFQHWIYTNPGHTKEERTKKYRELVKRFSFINKEDELLDLESYDWYLTHHIYHSPFYFIEYAISILASISIYKNYMENKEETINKFIEFMKLSNSKDLPTTYKAAGIEFNFSKDYIKEQMNFLEDQINKLNLI